MNDLRFPSLQALKGLIKRFQRQDPKISSVNDYTLAFGKLITHFSFPVFVTPATIKMHRVRLHDRDELFTSLEDLWSPPRECVKKIGRCNDIGDQILYMSGGGDTSLRELNPKPGALVSCLECQVLEPIQSVEIGVLRNIQSEVYLRQYAAIHKTSLASGYENDKKLIALDKELKLFIEQEFTKIVQPGFEHLYKVTAGIAKQFFLSDDIEALLYPSVRSQKKTINYAIPRSIAEKKLKPIRIDVFRIMEDSRFPNFKLQLIKGAYENLALDKPIIYNDPKLIDLWATPEIMPARSLH